MFCEEGLTRIRKFNSQSPLRQICEHVLREFLAGGSVKDNNVSFNAIDINERLETKSYPQWEDGYEPKGMYQLYDQTLEDVRVRFEPDDEMLNGGYVGTNACNKAAILRGIQRFERDEGKKKRLQKEKRVKRKAEATSKEQGFDLGGESVAYLKDSLIPPTYEPDSYGPFDAAAKFQSVSPYSPTTLIPYPTPLWVVRPSPSKDLVNLDETDFETDSE
ncbi:hypothetical protein Q3G72_021883 [Acer saccharum]|nr:hypothetical protein Q3G72_021883 [Acer saccharum]